MEKKTEIKRLSKRELEGYREWLAELNEEAHMPGGDLSKCDKDLHKYFDTQGYIGRQVYESFSDDELLDIMIPVLQVSGAQAQQAKLYCIYKAYILKRFHKYTEAKDKARARMKLLADQRRWPPDWHTRVSAEPLLEKLRQKGKKVTPEDMALLERLCAEARDTGKPPYISLSIRKRLDKLYNQKLALELMGIPVLSQTALKHMQRYWDQGRAIQAEMKAAVVHNNKEGNK